MNRNLSLIFFFVFHSIFLHAQQLTGCLKDATTGEELSNVSIYFSGTSIGVVSGLNGCFSILYRPELNAPLVFSVLGYEKLVIEKPTEINLSALTLTPKVDDLETVYLNPDPWTRVEKERWFKKLFLGQIPESSSCSIINLKDVRLRFNPSTGLLTAVCNVPIIIENKHLGYKISYDLIDFEGLFRSVDLSDKGISINGKTLEGIKYSHESSFIAGTAFFAELDMRSLKESQRNKNRRIMFDKSPLKFYRSLTHETLKNDGYILYRKGFLVNIEKEVRVKNNGDFFTVEFRHPNYGVNDKHGNKSTLVLNEQRIFIDSYGNNLSPRAIQLGGYFGIQQIAGLLPLEYGLEKME